jgi:hypothetical protein
VRREWVKARAIQLVRYYQSSMKPELDVPSLDLVILNPEKRTLKRHDAVLVGPS